MTQSCFQIIMVGGTQRRVLSALPFAPLSALPVSVAVCSSCARRPPRRPGWLQLRRAWFQSSLLSSKSHSQSYARSLSAGPGPLRNHFEKWFGKGPHWIEQRAAEAWTHHNLYEQSDRSIGDFKIRADIRTPERRAIGVVLPDGQFVSPHCIW